MKQSLVTIELKAPGVGNSRDTMADNETRTSFKHGIHDRYLDRVRGYVGQKLDESYCILSFKFLRDNVYYFITACVGL